MNGTRVAVSAGQNVKSGAAEETSCPAKGLASGTEHVLAMHPVKTPRGDVGRLVLLLGAAGLVLVERIHLPDGSVLECSRTLREPAALQRALRRVTLDGDAVAANRQLMRLVDQYFSRTRGL